MKKIDVSTLKPGMAFDRPVFIDKDNRLVDAYEQIQQTDIDRLKKWSIKELESDGQPVETKYEVRLPQPEGPEKRDIDAAIEQLKKAAGKRETVRDLINNATQTLETGYSELISDKPYQISQLRNLAEDIVSMSVDNPLGYITLYYLQEEQSLYKHIVYAAFFAAYLGNALAFSTPKNIELVFSILLMDIGMEQVPAEIRTKEGKLTEAELNKLHAHPLLGYQLLTQKAKVKNNIAQVALQHQEHFDGSGYPRKIKGDEITEFARIAMITDSYVALLEDKSYRTKKLPYEAMKELLALGIYNYDPQLMKVFLNHFSVYPVGSLVEISDETIGMVAASFQDKPMRPLVYIVRTAEGITTRHLHFYHLLYKPTLYIAKPLLPEQSDFVFDNEMSSILERD